jgi:predicted small integral membrane protein
MTDPRDYEARPMLRHSWYDYSWDWAMASLFVLVILAGIAVWTFADPPRTAAILDDATTGQSIRPSAPHRN